MIKRLIEKDRKSNVLSRVYFENNFLSDFQKFTEHKFKWLAITNTPNYTERVYNCLNCNAMFYFYDLKSGEVDIIKPTNSYDQYMKCEEWMIKNIIE